MVYIFAQGDKARSQQNEIGEVTGETFGKPILAINNLDLRTASDGANDKMQRFRVCNIRRSFAYEGVFRPVETNSIQLFLPQILWRIP